MTKRTCCPVASFRHAGAFRQEAALQLPYPPNSAPEDRTREVLTIWAAKVLESFSSFVEQPGVLPCLGGHRGSRASQAELASSAAIPRPILSVHSFGGGCLPSNHTALEAFFPKWCTASTVHGNVGQSSHGMHINTDLISASLQDSYR